MTLSAAALGAIEQDRAAGGKAMRQLRLKNGEIVTASLKLVVVKSLSQGPQPVFSIAVRFSTGGQTLTRTAGQVTGQSRFAALKNAWVIVREGNVLSKDGWSWVVPAQGNSLVSGKSSS